VKIDNRVSVCAMLTFRLSDPVVRRYTPDCPSGAGLLT
jgi:hypothetical protein